MKQVFSKIKEVLTKNPILHLLDFSSPFMVETNASGTSIGAVLVQ